MNHEPLVLEATVQLRCHGWRCEHTLDVVLQEPVMSDSINEDAWILAEEKHGWKNKECDRCVALSEDFDDGDFDPYEEGFPVS